MSDNTRPDVTSILQSNNLGTPEESVDRVSQTSPVGALSTAIGDSLFGINHRQLPGAVPINKDYFGMTFFTKPRLNFSTDNLRHARILNPLLSTQQRSIQRVIRTLLDPELQWRDGIPCEYVDQQQAFIPMLSNHLLSMSGWPDVIAPTMTSHEGVYKEAFSMVDGVTANYSTYDIQANFRNIDGDPITSLFFYWVHYASLVFQGVLVPYPDMIINNEMDYCTRIYRLVLDRSKTYVQKIGACGAGFPVNSPMGAAFNFERDRPINSSNDQISIDFRCMGAMYQDVILVNEFNQTVIMFNDTMSSIKDTVNGDTVTSSSGYYKKVPGDAVSVFNNRGYPRINPISYELEWWVSNEDYNYYLPLLNSK